MNPTSENTRSKEDWHPADVKAALAKAGFSFARITRESDFKGSTSNVLRLQWPRMEALVGKILNMHPSKIWPSRYDAQGKPLRFRGTDNLPKRRNRRNS